MAADHAREVYQNPDSANLAWFFQLNGIAEDTVLIPGTMLVVPTDQVCTAAEVQLAANLREPRFWPRGIRGPIEHPEITNRLYELLEYTQTLQTPGGPELMLTPGSVTSKISPRFSTNFRNSTRTPIRPRASERSSLPAPLPGTAEPARRFAARLAAPRPGRSRRTAHPPQAGSLQQAHRSPLAASGLRCRRDTGTASTDRRAEPGGRTGQGARPYRHRPGYRLVGGRNQASHRGKPPGPEPAHRR